MPSVFGQLEAVEQRVELSADALAHMYGYRQTSSRATEAGGQLFGVITPELIQVFRATGPYPADDRSRYRYRSNSAAAQMAIQKQFQARPAYCIGEWHTHAEDQPDSSGLDDDTMRLLVTRSQLNSNALLMLIVGRKKTVESLALWAIAPDRIYKWALA